MDRIKLDAWVGIFVALGLIALMGLAMKVGNLTSNDIKTTYYVTANFENIGGLKPRAPVKSAGVVVGRVDSIVFDTKIYEAIVTMSIDEDEIADEGAKDGVEIAKNHSLLFDNNWFISIR